MTKLYTIIIYIYRKMHIVSVANIIFARLFYRNIGFTILFFLIMCHILLLLLDYLCNTKEEYIDDTKTTHRLYNNREYIKYKSV